MSRIEKIHFAYKKDTFCLSTGLETVSESASQDTLMCVEHNLGKTYRIVVIHNSLNTSNTPRPFLESVIHHSLSKL